MNTDREGEGGMCDGDTEGVGGGGLTDRHPDVSAEGKAESPG